MAGTGNRDDIIQVTAGLLSLSWLYAKELIEDGLLSRIRHLPFSQCALFIDALRSGVTYGVRLCKRYTQVIAMTVMAAVSISSVHASIFDQFRDEDGWFDVSNWVLDNAIGFLPVPIVITEPAIGEGLGMAAAFFHPPNNYSKEEYEKARAESKPASPESGEDFVLPDVSAIAIAATNNGSWFAGGGHFAHWKGDTIRYNGALGYASLNLKFYGLSGGFNSDDGLSFSGEGVFIDQPISFRLGNSDFFLGGGYSYLNIDTTFDIGSVLPGFPPLEATTTLSGLRIFVDYDSRDTMFTPSSGARARLSYESNDKAIGSDFNYDSYKAYIHKYWTLNPEWVLGLRGDMRGVTGEIPFFMVPYIDLRAIPAMRYQGDTVVVAETEIRLNFHPRFSAVGFLGFGKAADESSHLNDAQTRDTQGLGIRYHTARKLGMYSGIDVARGPEDTYWYITLGSAW